MAASVRDVQNLQTTVVGLQGNPVSNAVPVVGDALVWDGSQWLPSAPPPPAPPLNGPIIGVTDGSDAAPGMVGEYVSAVETTFSYTANNEFATANQISLTPGDWDLSANVLFDGTNATPSEIQLIIAQILLTTNASEAVYNESNFLRGAMISPTQIVAVASVLTPIVRMNITTTTTVYLRVLAYWNTTSDNLTVASAILARRAR